MKLIVIFLIFFVSQYAFAQERVFPKAPRKTKVTEYLIKGDTSKFDLPIEVKFNITLKKNRNSKKNDLYLLSVGCQNYPCYEVVKQMNDTLYYLSNEENNQFSPLFIMNKEALGDTLFIAKFGIIENQNIVLDNMFLSKKLEDVVFSFKLYKIYDDKVDSQNIKYVDSGDREKINIHEIALSPEYGFVWVKYEYFGVYYFIRFY